jgi:hypothetical protein
LSGLEVHYDQSRITIHASWLKCSITRRLQGFQAEDDRPQTAIAHQPAVLLWTHRAPMVETNASMVEIDVCGEIDPAARAVAIRRFARCDGNCSRVRGSPRDSRDSASIVGIGGGDVARDEMLAARNAGKSVLFIPADMDHQRAREKARKQGSPEPALEQVIDDVSGKH